MTPTPKQVMLIGNMMNHDARMEFGEPNSQEKTTTWANEISPAQASAHATCELCTRGSIMSGAGTGGIVQSDFSTSMICHDMSRFSSYPSVIPHLLENEQVASPCFIMLHHSSWFIIVHHGSSWFSLVHHGSSWFIVVYHGSSWFIVVHNGSSWFIMVYHGLSWFIMV